MPYRIRHRNPTGRRRSDHALLLAVRSRDHNHSSRSRVGYASNTSTPGTSSCCGAELGALERVLGALVLRRVRRISVRRVAPSAFVRFSQCVDSLEAERDFNTGRPGYRKFGLTQFFG